MENRTPLHIAAEYQSKESKKRLISKEGGRSLQAVKEKEETLITKEIIEILISKGSDVNARDFKF